MITDLNTYLHKAVPDTRLTIKKYLDAKFEYLVSTCLIKCRVRTPPGNLEYSWIFIWNFSGPGKPGEMMLFFEI